MEDTKSAFSKYFTAFGTTTISKYTQLKIYLVGLRGVMLFLHIITF